MKKKNIYRIAPLSFGHLPQGEREDGRSKTEDRRLWTEPGLVNFLNHHSNFPAPLSPFNKGDETRFTGTEGVKNPQPATATSLHHCPLSIRGTRPGLPGRRGLRSRKLEVGSWKLVAGSWKPAFKSPKAVVNPDEVPNSVRVGRFEITARRNEMSTRCTEILAQHTEISARCTEIPAQHTEISARCMEMTARCTEISAQYTEIPARCTETGKENKEYRISNTESGRNIPVQACPIPEGLHVYRRTANNGNSTPNGVVQSTSLWYFYKHLVPLASGRGKLEVGRRYLTCNDIQTISLPPSPLGFIPVEEGPGEAQYKANPLLPRGRFYSGDCPGAAAITIISFLFSSPRVSPNFAGATRNALSGLRGTHPFGEPLSAYEPTALPVINLQALHQGSFVPLVEGDEIRFSESGGAWDKSRFIGTGGHGDKTPENQGVSITSLKTRTRGFKSERRYAHELN